MDRRKAAYWALTAPVAMVMAASRAGYLSSSPQMVEAFAKLGYPLYFMTTLGAAKLHGFAKTVVPLGVLAFLPGSYRLWEREGAAG